MKSTYSDRITDFQGFIDSLDLPIGTKINLHSHLLLITDTVIDMQTEGEEILAKLIEVTEENMILRRGVGVN